MTNSKKVNLIISFILAFSLWMYVVMEVNPTTKANIDSVNITLTNEQGLENKGMAVISVSEKQVSLQVSGKLNVTNSLKRNQDEITATADLSSAVLGSNDIAVKIDLPYDGLSVTRQSLSKVTVKVGRLTSAYKPVRVRYRGKTSPGKEATTLKADPEKIKVTGADVQVRKIDHIEGTMDIGSVTDRKSSRKCRLKAVDASGKEVKYVTLEKRTAEVTSILYIMKTVPLTVPVKGESSDDYERSYETPSEITIKGLKKDVEKVDVLEASSVDLSRVTKNEVLDLNVKLPEGIMLSDKSNKLTIAVKVKSPQISRDFSISSSAVSVNGLAEGTSASVSGSGVLVSVTGSKDVLDSVSKKDISVSVNAGGKSPGTYSLDVSASVSAEYTSISTKPEKVQVTIYYKKSSSGSGEDQIRGSENSGHTESDS